MRTRETTALAALGAILAITASWWALALWPLPAAAPGWLLRTRVVCFGTTPSGLPDTAGWIALVGQPALMLGALLVVWGDAVAAGLGALARSRAGRGALGCAVTALAVGAGAAGARIAGAAAARRAALAPAAPGPADTRRIDRAAPPLELVDQHGERVSLARFRGRPVIVAFAYAHCETVCPLVVRDVLRAGELAAERSPVVLIVTLDPWRDTPPRLPSIARQWRLAGDAFVASGDTSAVVAALARWNVARERDLRTGEVIHATPVYLVDRAGRIAYILSGSVGAGTLADFARRL